MNHPQKTDLSNKLLRYGYWSWAADEPATHQCDQSHEECAVESHGVCMQWLSQQVNVDYPVQEGYPPLTIQDLENL